MAEDLIQVTMKPTVEELKRRLGKKISKLKDMSTAYSKISIMLDRWVQTNFRTEGGKVGGWLPFAVGGRWVRKKGLDTSAKLLQDTGRMKASYLPFSFKDNAGIGTTLPYARKHEEGDEVPQRRTLPVKKDVIDGARKILNNEVKKVTES